MNATFLRFEGVLSARPSIAAAAYFAANAPTLLGRLPKLAGVAASLPFSLARRATRPDLDRRIAWLCVRGESDDRLEEIGAEYAARVLVPSLERRGCDLVAAARRDGIDLVLVSDNVDVVLLPLAARLGIPHVLCNRLERRNGRATGRLAGAVVGDEIESSILRDYARARGIDLSASAAYASRAADRSLLGAVGTPVVLSPDAALRRLASDLQWAVT